MEDYSRIDIAVFISRVDHLVFFPDLVADKLKEI